jgi:hypothetical protein
MRTSPQTFSRRAGIALPTFSAPQATEMPLAQPTHFECLYSHAFYPIGIGIRYAPLCWNASQAVKLHRNCRMLGFGSGAAHSPIGATSQEPALFRSRPIFQDANRCFRVLTLFGHCRIFHQATQNVSWFKFSKVLGIKKRGLPNPFTGVKQDRALLHVLRTG